MNKGEAERVGLYDVVALVKERRREMREEQSLGFSGV